MEAGTDNLDVPMEGTILPSAFLTFDDVQDRLVEAMITLWRLPDRERGLLRTRASDGPWHLVMPEQADYDGGREAGRDRVEAALRTASATRRDIAEMEEALGWIEVLAPADRKLVGLAIAELARGRRQVAWSKLLRPLGLSHGSDGLRMRYSQAITRICTSQNRRKSTGSLSMG